jgi:hypothetical protein
MLNGMGKVVSAIQAFQQLELTVFAAESLLAQFATNAIIFLILNTQMEHANATQATTNPWDNAYFTQTVPAIRNLQLAILALYLTIPTKFAFLARMDV